MFALLLALSACGFPKETERVTLFSVTDFTPYTQKGFLITPEQYLGDYESIGLIKVYVWPAVKKYERGMNLADENWEKRGSGEEVWLIERIDMKTIIDEAYKKASAMGADGIVRFNVTSSVDWSSPLSMPYYEVGGFAIKRKPSK